MRGSIEELVAFEIARLQMSGWERLVPLLVEGVSTAQCLQRCKLPIKMVKTKVIRADRSVVPSVPPTFRAEKEWWTRPLVNKILWGVKPLGHSLAWRILWVLGRQHLLKDAVYAAVMTGEFAVAEVVLADIPWDETASVAANLEALNRWCGGSDA